MADYYYNNPCYSARVTVPGGAGEEAELSGRKVPRYATGGSVSADCTGSQLEQRLLADMKGPTACACLGGIIFHSTDDHNMPIICFLVKEPAEEEVKAAGTWYHYLKRLELPGLMAYEGSYTVGDRVVFTFMYGGDDTVSLRQVLDSSKMKSEAPEMMLQLVRFLDVYQKELKIRNKTAPGDTYIPLNCICLDTVFLTPRGELRILPLRPYRNEFPLYFPGEAGKEQGDVTTDLFTVALLTVQLMSGCEAEGENGQRMQDNTKLPFLRMCLAPFKSWRPTLKRVLNDLEAATGNREPARQEVPHEQSAPYRDPSGNIVREGGGRKTGEAWKEAGVNNPIFAKADDLFGSMYKAVRGVISRVAEPASDTGGSIKGGSFDSDSGYGGDRPQKINPNVSNRRSGGNRDDGGDNA